MAKTKSIRVNFELKGDMADAFVALLTEFIQKDPSASKADVGRAAFVEYANKRGYNLKDETQWGGKRAEEGQPAAVSAT